MVRPPFEGAWLITDRLRPQ